jgi:hypothetical protein
MKIKNEASALKEAFSIIKDANLGEITGGSSVLFFPFEIDQKVEERETGVILVEMKTEGSKNLVKPGFLIGPSFEPEIAYVTTEYSIPIDIETHLGLFPNQKQSLNKKRLEVLKTYECSLIRSQQVLATFKF